MKLNRERESKSLRVSKSTEKINEGKTLLKEKIDAMILPFKSSNPAFYGEYKVARTIVERAAGHGSKGTGGEDVPVGDGK